MRRADLKTAESLARNLNSHKEFPLLTELAETWIMAKYRLDRWAHRDRLEALVRKFPWRLEQSKSAPVRLDSGLIFKGAEAALLGSQKDLAVWNDLQAAEIFFEFVSGQFYDKLAKCHRKHCGRFLIKTRSDKVYCSQECASAVTAFKAVIEQRKEKRRLDVMKVQSALKKWSEYVHANRYSNKRDDKTTWLAKRTGLSKKFITIALREIGS
jgi:hypothetical protein